MPTDADRDELTEQQPEPPVAPAAPTFGLEDVSRMVAEGIREGMRSMQPPTPQRRETSAPDPEPEAATEEDFRDNMPVAIAKTVNRALHPLRQQMNAFQQFGLERLTEIQTQVKGADLPYYKDYKAEIDAEMAQVDPVTRSQPMTLTLIHDRVAMRHEAERIARARDEGARQARGDAPTPGSINSRNKPATPDVPTPETLGFNEDQIGEIEQRGGPDAFAQRISGGRFKSWAEYAASKKSMDSQPRGSLGRRVMPFTRMQPGKKIPNAA